MEVSKEFEDYFASLNLEIRLYPSSIRKTFKSFNIFYDFIQDEYKYWSQCAQGQTVASIRSHFNIVKSYIDQALSYAQNYLGNPHAVQQQLRDSISRLKTESFPCIYSTTEEGKLILSYYKKHPSQADAICDYLFNNRHRYYNDLEYFKGMVDIHINKNFSAMNEAASTSAVQSIEDTISRSYDELSNLHTEFYGKHSELVEKNRLFKQDVGAWEKSITAKTESFLAEKESKLNNLEKLYNEKLRLEGPAKYWKDIEVEYRSNGARWTWISAATSIAFAFMLYIILVKAPESIFGSTQLNINSLRATIILGLIASVGVYLLRLFVKLAISSFHLSRDAKERYQLTHVYLSLLDNAAIKDSERNIVLQAIFSRSDTGLLKGDSSPTLPDSVSQVIKTLNK